MYHKNNSNFLLFTVHNTSISRFKKVIMTEGCSRRPATKVVASSGWKLH